MFKSNPFTSLNKKTSILAIIVILAIAGVFLLKQSRMGITEQNGSGANIPESSAIQSIYTHASPKFSIEYPKGFSVGSFPEGQDSETILIHGVNGGNSMQILISPFDEDITLTKKRILKDAPDTEIKNEKEITIGKTAKGIQFQSVNTSGPTTEVWFVYKNHLYQINAPQQSSEFLNAILTTWQWK